jgi:AcrR family transcriptional regulator
MHMNQSDAKARVDPLFETLFRPTAVASTIGSAAPVPTVGTHSRAGNAMSRTRAALLAGAARAVAKSGTKVTMSQVAVNSGVAKATLYNHFRTRDAVLSALLDHEVEVLLETFTHAPLDRALVAVASNISNQPLLRALATVEPATLAAIARVDVTAPGWRAARDAVQAALQRAGLGGTDIVLRWLASYLMTPAGSESITEDVQILLAGLPVEAGSRDAERPLVAADSRPA